MVTVNQYLQQFSATSKAVNPDGTFTTEISAILQGLIDSVNANAGVTQDGLDDENAALNAHIAETAEAEDVHATATYTNQQVAIHAALTAALDDVHGTKTYTDQQDAIHAALNADPNDVHGTKTYTDTEIAALSSAVQDNFAYFAYGSMDITAFHADGNIGAGWQDIDFFDRQLIPAVNVTLFNSGVIRFPEEGVYILNLNGALDHTSAVIDRIFRIRLFNASTATGGLEYLVATGIGNEMTNVSISVIIKVSAAEVLELFRFQYGGTIDAYSVIEWRSLMLSVHSVGEFFGTL